MNWFFFLFGFTTMCLAAQEHDAIGILFLVSTGLIGTKMIDDWGRR